MGFNSGFKGLNMSPTFFWGCPCVTESMVTDVSRQHSDVIFKGQKPWNNWRTYETAPLSPSVEHHLTLVLCLGEPGGRCWIYSNIYPTRCNFTQFIYIRKLVLHDSGGTTIHHQERMQLYLQHLVFVTPLPLPAAIVEELEPVWVCCAHSNRFQLFQDSGW